MNEIKVTTAHFSQRAHRTDSPAPVVGCSHIAVAFLKAKVFWGGRDRPSPHRLQLLAAMSQSVVRGTLRLRYNSTNA